MKPANWFDNLITSPRRARAVSQHQYDTWKEQGLLDVLSGIRYGQSFCDRFDIQDNILYYYRDHKQADAYIKRYYLSG